MQDKGRAGGLYLCVGRRELFEVSRNQSQLREHVDRCGKGARKTECDWLDGCLFEYMYRGSLNH